MNVKEIDEQIAKLQALREKALVEEKDRVQRLQKNFDEAVELYPELIRILRRLDEVGYLPLRLYEVLKDQTGKFNPGQYIKRPRVSDRPTDENPTVKQPD